MNDKTLKEKDFVTEICAEYNANSISEKITAKWVGKSIYFYNVINSTNVYAKEAAEKGAVHGTLIVADKQTAGRGRRGREWDSPAGSNIYFTLILRPDITPDTASMLTLVMALAAAEGILKATGIQTEIKWPNDIVINGKKAVGILTEMILEKGKISAVFCGVGMNVKKQVFAPEISDKAVSLEEVCQKQVSRAELLAKVMTSFEKFYEIFIQTGNLSTLQEQYHKILVNRNREVCILEPDREDKGIARGINEKGELLVEMQDGSIREVYAGEVSVRGVYGYV